MSNAWKPAPRPYAWRGRALALFTLIPTLAFAVYVNVAHGDLDYTARGVFAFLFIAVPILLGHTLALGAVAIVAGSVARRIDEHRSTSKRPVTRTMAFAVTTGLICWAAAFLFWLLVPYRSESTPVFVPSVCAGLAAFVCSFGYSTRALQLR